MKFLVLFVLLTQVNIGYGQSHIHIFDIVEDTVPKNKNGDYHGNGKIVWELGDSYEGGFKNNLFHGFGIMKW